MVKRSARHVGPYYPARDVTLALARPGAGRHQVAPAAPVDVTLAELLEPVVPGDFPGFPPLAPLPLAPSPLPGFSSVVAR